MYFGGKKMKDYKEKIYITELSKSQFRGYELQFKYKTRKYYDVVREKGLFSISLELKEFDREIEKAFTGKLFENYLENPTAYQISNQDVPLGFIEIDRESWSNRLRITELLIFEEFRGFGYGSKLIDKAKEVAQKEKFREVILETQSCNYSAIKAYIKNGFVVNGLDLSCYSNNDVESKEVRIEMVYKI